MEVSAYKDTFARDNPANGTQASMSYAELQALTNRVARVLTEDMKLVPSNRILLRGPNNLMMAAAWLGTIKAGLVTVPTMSLLCAKELKQIIDKAQVQAMLSDGFQGLRYRGRRCIT